MNWTMPYPCRARSDSVRRINMSSEPGNESFFCALRPIPRILSLWDEITRVKFQIGEPSRRKTISGCSRAPGRMAMALIRCQSETYRCRSGRDIKDYHLSCCHGPGDTSPRSGARGSHERWISSGGQALMPVRIGQRGCACSISFVT
jgi:hypothetical protein